MAHRDDIPDPTHLVGYYRVTKSAKNANIKK